MKTIARRRGGGTEKHDDKGRVVPSKQHESEGDGMADLAHAKHVGPVQGRHGRHHASHKPRKNGGTTGSDRMPFSSARHGREPSGRHTMPDD